jgi:cytochrome c553
MTGRAGLALVAALGSIAAPLVAAAAEPPAGASSCSGCHAPPGRATAIPAIAGREAPELLAAMEAFRSGSRPATVMDRIMKGFAPDEMKALADWWASQR